MWVIVEFADGAERNLGSYSESEARELAEEWMQYGNVENVTIEEE